MRTLRHMNPDTLGDATHCLRKTHEKLNAQEQRHVFDAIFLAPAGGPVNALPVACLMSNEKMNVKT